jgi:hypothetical protein
MRFMVILRVALVGAERAVLETCRALIAVHRISCANLEPDPCRVLIRCAPAARFAVE